MVSRAHLPGERPAGDLAPVPDKLTVDSFVGKICVQWTLEEAVTPLGQLPFFIDFLKPLALLQQLVRQVPLTYDSPNAQTPLGRAGDTRAAHGGGGRR